MISKIKDFILESLEINMEIIEDIPTFMGIIYVICIFMIVLMCLVIFYFLTLMLVMRGAESIYVVIITAGIILIAYRIVKIIKSKDNNKKEGE